MGLWSPPRRTVCLCDRRRLYVARRDHRGPMDAREAVIAASAPPIWRGPARAVDPIDLLIRPFAIRRVPGTACYDVRTLIGDPGSARRHPGVLVAIDQPQVLEDALVRELSAQRFFIAQDDRRRPPETQPGHGAIVRPVPGGSSDSPRVLWASRRCELGLRFAGPRVEEAPLLFRRPRQDAGVLARGQDTRSRDGRLCWWIRRCRRRGSRGFGDIDPPSRFSVAARSSRRGALRFSLSCAINGCSSSATRRQSSSSRAQ